MQGRCSSSLAQAMRPGFPGLARVGFFGSVGPGPACKIFLVKLQAIHATLWRSTAVVLRNGAWHQQ